MLNINKEKLGLDTKVYGFKMSKDNTIEYLEDAVGKAPAHMNYETGKFDWGDWSDNEFFIPRPCLFADDKFQCYLDNDENNELIEYWDKYNKLPNNYDFYMHFGYNEPIYYLVEDIATVGCKCVYFSNKQISDMFIPLDFTFAAFPFQSKKLNSFRGRSMCNVPLLLGEEHAYKTHINTDITIQQAYGDFLVTVITQLMILISKTTDFNKAYGNVHERDEYTSNYRVILNTAMKELVKPIHTGMTAGISRLFWGSNAKGAFVRKAFGIEMFYNPLITDCANGGETSDANICDINDISFDMSNLDMGSTLEQFYDILGYPTEA